MVFVVSVEHFMTFRRTVSREAGAGDMSRPTNVSIDRKWVPRGAAAETLTTVEPESEELNPRPTGGGAISSPPLVFLQYLLSQCRYHHPTILHME